MTVSENSSDEPLAGTATRSSWRALLAQAGPQAIVGAADQHSQIVIFARDIAEVLEKVADLMAVVRTAATSDPELKGLFKTFHEGRRRNINFVTKVLLLNGPMRNGLDDKATTAMLWRLASPELFLLMRDVEGITSQAYSD